MLAAIFFDLDGTLVNTDPLHFRVWQEVLQGYGLEIDETFYKSRISGRLNPAIVRDLLPTLSEADGLRMAADKEARFRELGQVLEPLAGLAKMLAWTEELGLKRAVVTNAPPENARFLLDVLRLSEAFDPVVIAAEVGVGKPDPAPYQFALDRLNLTPDTVITFEDSPSGIRSSVGAGIVTVGIASTHLPEHLCDAGAVMAVPDFTAEPLWDWLPSAPSVPHR